MRPGGLSPVEPGHDRAAVVVEGSLERPDTVGEPALDRRVEHSGLADRGPPDAPEVRTWVVQPKRVPAEPVTVGQRAGRVVGGAQPVEDGLDRGGALELDPLGATRVEGVDQPAVTDSPDAIRKSKS